MSNKTPKKNYLLQEREEVLETENLKLQAILAQRQEEIVELKGQIETLRWQLDVRHGSDTSSSSETPESDSDDESFSQNRSDLMEEAGQHSVINETSREEIKLETRIKELELRVKELEQGRVELERNAENERKRTAELEKLYTTSQEQLYVEKEACKRSEEALGRMSLVLADVQRSEGIYKESEANLEKALTESKRTNESLAEKHAVAVAYIAQLEERLRSLSQKPDCLSDVAEVSVEPKKDTPKTQFSRTVSSDSAINLEDCQVRLMHLGQRPLTSSN